MTPEEEVEFARLKRDLAATRAECERWYAAFNEVLRERDLLRKELVEERRPAR